MPSSDINRRLRYEKEKAKAHNGKHVDGPGMHDYERSNARGERPYSKERYNRNRKLIWVYTACNRLSR